MGLWSTRCDKNISSKTETWRREEEREEAGRWALRCFYRHFFFLLPQVCKAKAVSNLCFFWLPSRSNESMHTHPQCTCSVVVVFFFFFFWCPPKPHGCIHLASSTPAAVMWLAQGGGPSTMTFFFLCCQPKYSTRTPLRKRAVYKKGPHDLSSGMPPSGRGVVVVHHCRKWGAVPSTRGLAHVI